MIYSIIYKGCSRSDAGTLIPEEPKTVTAICTDMYDEYINAAKSVFKNKTIIVVDRFHVAKQYRGELDKYRQKISKQLKNELSYHEYEKLKGAMPILRRNNECLTQDKKTILDNLLAL